jgi:hypothetical protein
MNLLPANDVSPIGRLGKPGSRSEEEAAGPMADLHKVSIQVADVAERLADVADAARGQRSRKRGALRWVVLPLAGAMAYAVVKRGLKGPARAEDVASEARRTPEQPDSDLLGRVKDVVGGTDQLERNREDRAKRRRRRASAST